MRKKNKMRAYHACHVVAHLLAIYGGNLSTAAGEELHALVRCAARLHNLMRYDDDFMRESKSEKKEEKKCGCCFFFLVIFTALSVHLLLLALTWSPRLPLG